MALPLTASSDLGRSKAPPESASTPATPDKTEDAEEIDPSSLPRKSRKMSRNDRPTYPRGGRGQRAYGSNNLRHKSPRTPISNSPASSMNCRTSSPGAQNMTPPVQFPTGNVHQNTPPHYAQFHPVPSSSPSPAGTRPSNNEVDALIALLQKARTTDPALQNKTLLEVELELKLSQQGAQPSSPHFPVAPMPLGTQSTNHAEFATWGKKPNGELGWVSQKTFTPTRPQTANVSNAFSNYGRRRSGGSQSPQRFNGSPASNRSSPRGSPGPRRFPDRGPHANVPMLRGSPEPSARPVWPTSKDDLKQQVLTKTSGTKRMGPSLDEITAPRDSPANQNVASLFAVKGD